MNAIEMIAIRKAFGPTVALESVTTEIHTGSVHALLGENGAGKSTTVKMLSGLLRPDSGQFRVFGHDVVINGPKDAHRLGIQTAFQEMTQVPDLTVTQNLLLPYEPRTALGLVARRKSRQWAEQMLEELGLASINPDAVLRDLNLAQRQKIEIARAVSRKARILLLDEPTSALTGKDMEWLGGIIARLKSSGTTVIFISHRMLEVRDNCDRLTVLRNGRSVHEGAVQDVTDADIVRLIIGRSLSATFPEIKNTARPGPPALAAEGLAVGTQLAPTNFELKRGEVLGVAGLQGMGQLELFKACFGVVIPTAGRLLVDGEPVIFRQPSDAIRSGIDFGFIPEDRKTEGLLLSQTGGRNISLPVIDRFSRFGLINFEAERNAVLNALSRMQVEDRALTLAVSKFSGGNQQKMILARWLLAGSRTLLMFDPTRGVDIGTKAEIYRLIRTFVAEGGAVLFYSTEIEEVVNLSDRAVIFYGGRVVRTLERDQINEETIMETALGQNAFAHAT